MRKIEKHNFEAVSLLTVDNGLLNITVIPAIGQPDWLVPSSLILSIDEYHDYIWTYLWQNQEVAVYHLLPRNETPDTLVVLEGNTEVHRVGLLTKGKLQQKQVNISDVKDVPMPAGFAAVIEDRLDAPAQAETSAADADMTTYAYQAVEIDGQIYFVPDIDTLAHHLVDLDSY